jgi:drug/metabolite transporter (DMT)-like permease
VAGAALALAVFAIAWGSILVRLCEAPPLTIAFLRVAIAALLLAPPALIARRRRPPADRPWGGAAAAAGLLLSLHFAAWIASLSLTSIAASTLLVSTQPIVSVLLSGRLLGERAGARTIGAVLIALGGVGLILWGDLRSGGEERLTGDLLALAGAAAAAGYLVAGRRVRERVPLPTYLAAVNLWAAIGAGGLALLFAQPLLPAARRDLGWCALMAIVPHLLGHGTLNWAVRRLRAYLVNLAVLGEPVLASLYAFLVFGEAPPPTVYPGALLIGAGVALAFREAARRPPPPAGL